VSIGKTSWRARLKMKAEITKTSANLFATAFKLHTMGFSVIPSGGGGKGKAPIVNWVECQHRQPTDDELEKWQEELQPRLWGIVTGAISSLVVIDADLPESRAELEAELGQPHVITPRGGPNITFAKPIETFFELSIGSAPPSFGEQNYEPK
jgi:hypothetical protein